MTVQQKTAEDGKTRNVITINFRLAPDHIQTRAEKFKDLIYNHSETYKLDPALVFAIIHTESFYNPAAKSHANALGLMQLVPNSGGRDAYQHVYHKDGIPSTQYLFNPDNNVKLGTAYVDILSNNYLRGVENPEVKNYLVIAAYNTGAGNVSKAYINSTNIKNAFQKINQISPDETYDYLLWNLHYNETKDYLKKVVERRATYQMLEKNAVYEREALVWDYQKDEGHFAYMMDWLNRRVSHLDEWIVQCSPTSVIPNSIPTDYTLSQNYPNPFNPFTTISFTLP